MKKIISLALALLMCAMTVVTVSAGVAPITVTLESKEAAAGETIDLVLSIANPDGTKVNSLGMRDFTWDEDVLEYVSGEASEDIEDYTMFDPNIDVGTTGAITIAFSKARSYTGELATLTFKVKDTAEAGTYDITFATLMKNGSTEAASSAVKATITVKGDPSNDSRLNVAGAQVRIADSKNGVIQGLRFVSTITPELYQKIVDSKIVPKSASDTGLGFGSVVYPTTLLAGAKLTKETSGAMIIPAVKLFEAPSTTVKFTACMTNMLEANYAKEYTVRPYVTFMDGDTEVTIYGAQYSTSLFDVAKAVVDDKTEYDNVKEYVYKNILKVVDPKTYDQPTWSDIYRP